MGDVMDYYNDIKLLPDPEFPETVLMNAMYTKLHKTLCDLHATDIGVSFPNYQRTLGNLLRLHGTAQALDKLQCLNWLGAMSGYCQQDLIQPVPSQVSFRTVSRKQPLKSQSKMRRCLKRGTITEKDTKNYRAKMSNQGLGAPYVELLSGSNKQRYRRYIVLGPMQESPSAGLFDQFGLSKTATVPWF